MVNRIFESLLKEKIDFFKSSFSNTSKEVFYDQKDKKIFHNGEYGSYRESVVKDFLKFIVPRELDISSGFLITPLDGLSTQCDVIIFNSKITPLYEEGNRQKFFPIESVHAVGEIKSTLSKPDFKVALNKLAKNKALSEQMKSPYILKSAHGGAYDPVNNHRDLIPSFLICQKLNFNIENIENEIDSFYKGIEPRHRHNLILSIEDGLLLYFDSNNKSLPFPVFKKIELKNRLIVPEENKYVHFKQFSSDMFLLTEGKTLFYPEFSDYMGSIIGGINRNQK